MPPRPGLDDDAALEALIRAWVDGASDLQSRLDRVFSRIRAELSADVVNQNTVFRLQEQARRLTELRGTAVAIVDDLANETQDWIRGGGPERVYIAGAAASGLPFSFTQPHRAAVEVLSKDLYDDVLTATRFVEDDAKRWIREVGRQLAGFKLTGGVPVKTQARRFESEMRQRFEKEGIGKVVYRDGSRHSFGEYAEMQLRTKTGVMYNTGTLNTSRLLGIDVFELLDGAECGLTSHYDPEKANGKLVSGAFALAYPLSHPNCRRSIVPRPDVKSPDDRFTSVQSPEARADQAAFEKALRAQQSQRQARGASRRSQRPTRTSRTTRPARPTRTAPKPAERLTAPLTTLDHIDVEKRGQDYSKALPSVGEFHDVATGPKAESLSVPPGPGVAFVDDKGRLFYWERGDRSRDEVVADLTRLMEQNRVSLLKDMKGAPAHLVVQAPSLQELELRKAYNNDGIRIAANANGERVAYFYGRARDSTVWHENGHVVARAFNESLAEKLSDPRFSMSGLEKLGDAGKVMEVLGERAQAERLKGSFANPGSAWLDAQVMDRKRLSEVGSSGRPAYTSMFREWQSGMTAGDVTDPPQLSGVGLGADGKRREGVTNYGATNSAEDFAESWRLKVQADRAGGLGTYRSGKFMKIASFEDLYPNRAQVILDLMEATGLELPE